jgi:hypothetical protein
VTSPLRVLRQIVAPTGKHRPRRPVLLLPDEPLVEQTVPIPHVVLNETELSQLLDADEIATHEDADCPRCERATAHAVNRDTSRRCWDCGTTTLGDS